MLHRLGREGETKPSHHDVVHGHMCDDRRSSHVQCLIKEILYNKYKLQLLKYEIMSWSWRSLRCNIMLSAIVKNVSSFRFRHHHHHTSHITHPQTSSSSSSHITQTSSSSSSSSSSHITQTSSSSPIPAQIFDFCG